MSDKQSRVKARLRQLRLYESVGLDAKIRYANRLIEAGLEIAERPAVAWSGGKDSTVLLDLVRRFDPGAVVNFNNTGVEFPETLRFVKEIQGRWSLNLHVTRPDRSRDFWWCLEEFGYPLFGKWFARRRFGSWRSEKQHKVMTSGARVSPSCCYYCKEKPALDLYGDLGVDVVFLGIMAGESRRRRFNWCDYGDVRWNKHEQRWKIHPLSVWLEEDILEYHKRFDLPMCDLYSMGHRRNGCWPCGMDIAFEGNHLATLRRSHPKLWRFLMVDKGLGEELLKIKLALQDGQGDLFSATWDIEQLIEQRPCFFDRV